MLRPEHLAYLQELEPHVKASVSLLSTGIVLGILVAANLFELNPTLRDSLMSFAANFKGLPKLGLALAIFANNGVKTFLVLVLGFAGAILPVCFLLLNGFALGFVMYISVQARGLLSSLLAVAPHGIFELPAILLAASIGLLIGIRTLKRLAGNFATTLKSDMAGGLKFFWKVILPLLLLAAFVEAFVTSAIIKP